MELEALIRALAPREVTGARPVEIGDLAYDTRKATKGAAFFCVRGERVDGHDLAWEAIERGAVAVVVERPLEVDVPQLVVEDVRGAMAVAADAFFGEPTKELELAGVTGTNGKTTTCFLLQSVLEAAGRSAGLVGTVEWIVGGERRAAPFTTPEAIDLQRLFREMVDAGDRSAAVEASSHGAAFRRLDRVRFDALVFTNLTQDHLDLHGTMEEYFQAKRRLFTGPAAAARRGQRRGRVGAAPRRRPRRRASCAAGHVRPGRARGGAARGPRAHRAREQVSRGGDRDRDAPARALQRRERSRCRRRPACCSTWTRTRSPRGSPACSGVPGRFEAVDEGQPFGVIVDYSHTPDSLETALRAARQLAEGRVIVVFGAGGDRDRGKRPLMGSVAVELADVAIVTSDNPRSEDPLAIIQDVLQGAGLDVEIDPDRRSAIQRAVGLAAPGDVVVIAGKGHEQGQEIAGVVHPFDDRAVAREALAELRTSR